MNTPSPIHEEDELDRNIRIACQNHVKFDLSRRTKIRINRRKREFDEDRAANLMSPEELEEMYRLFYQFYKTNTTLKPSRVSRIRTNRTFRERYEADFLPFPEVDSRYEQIRSRLILRLRKLRRQFLK